MIPKWYPICAVDDIPLREGRCVSFGEHRVALFRLGNGVVRAVQNTCPHKQGPLADGMVHGETITCPLHTRTFDLKTGAGINEGDGQLRVYPAQIVSGRVYIAFEDAPDNARPEILIKASSYFKVTAIIRTPSWPATKQALEDIGCTSYARFRVLGRGEQRGLSLQNQPQEAHPSHDWRHTVPFLPKTLVEVIVDRGLLEAVISNLIRANQTGQPGDGKIFVTPLEEVVLDNIESNETEELKK
jgi:nitrite reductase (NADH) small subunit